MAKKFSMKSTHTKIELTISKLKGQKRSPERDKLIGKLEKFMTATNCGQDMLIEL